MMAVRVLTRVILQRIFLISCSVCLLSCSDVGVSGESIRQGDGTSLNTFPWLVKLRSMVAFRCSGVLIAPNWVLTSASCFHGDYNQDHYNIDLLVDDVKGDVSIIPQIVTSPAPSRRQEETVYVQSFYIHGRYQLNEASRYNLALVKLPRNVTSIYTPAELIGENDDVMVDSCVSVGWGANATGSKEAQTPTVRRWRVSHSANCSSQYGKTVEEDLLCAELLDPATGPCPGDVGSPLLCKGHDNSWKVTGLVTHIWRCHPDNQLVQEPQPATVLNLQFYIPFILKLENRNTTAMDQFLITN